MASIRRQPSVKSVRFANHGSIPRSEPTPYYDCSDPETSNHDGIYEAQLDPNPEDSTENYRNEIDKRFFAQTDGPNDYDGDRSSVNGEEVYMSDEAPAPTFDALEHAPRASHISVASQNPDQPLRHRRTPILAIRAKRAELSKEKSAPSRPKVTKAVTTSAPIDEPGNAGDIESGPSPMKTRLSISEKLTRSFAGKRMKRSASASLENAFRAAQVTPGLASNGLSMTESNLPNSVTPPGRSEHSQTVYKSDDFDFNSRTHTPEHMEGRDDMLDIKEEKSGFASNDGREPPRPSGETGRSTKSLERIDRQKFVILLCRALMLTGAPTHRLEEYMRRLSKFLSLEGQFLYLPGCMIVSFGDSSSHTSEMQIIRTAQGIDVTKFEDIYRVYKDVAHERMGVDEAFIILQTILEKKSTFSIAYMIALYGIATALVSVFAFDARWVDMPFCGLFGVMLGYLQLVVAPRSDLYTNVFEILAAIISSFLARALGSARGGNIFCFSAISQSSIALILPGWAILCGALEIQSKNIIAGSIRLFYALVHSLFLGFGVSIGTALYGWMDSGATVSMTCLAEQYSPDVRMAVNTTLVLAFIFCLTQINMTTNKTDIVAMTTIAFLGYFAQDRTLYLAARNPQIANCVGAFVVGVLGNLYSRVFKGMGFTAMLPGILLQVPSGLSSRGSILAGIQIANDLVTNTIRPVELQYDAAAYAMGVAMIQIAIGITVGLFMAALVVYPWGKKKTLIFSF